MLQDIRFAFRNLMKTPGVFAIAVITLALGIGANTAMFGVVKAVLLASLPYPHPDRLMQLHESNNTGDLVRVSRPNFQDWHDRARSFEYLAYGYSDHETLYGVPRPERIPFAAISAEFFRAFGVRPEIGRLTLPSDHREGVAPVAVISHALWQREFNGDPHALNRTVNMEGHALTIVGVMPPSFDFPGHADLWVPIEMVPDPSTRSALNYDVYGRIRDGVAVTAAQADMDRVAAGLAREYIDDKGFGIRVTPLYDRIVGPVRPALLILLSAVGFVLLIACVNIANLQLARGSTRVREMALRAALGAMRGRLVRQLLTESILLATAGGLAGLILAVWATELLKASIPADIPRIENIHIDAAVFAFTLGVSLLAGLFFGVLPAISTSGVNLTDALKEGSSKTTLSTRHRRAGNALVIAEIGIATVLLTGAGLLIQTFRNLSATDPGFSTTGILTADIAWPIDSDNTAEVARVVGLTRTMLGRIRAIPGVEAAGEADSVPIKGFHPDGCFAIAGRPVPADPHQCPDADYSAITVGYFQALRVPILRGRTFEPSDERPDVPQLAVVNEAFVREFFPHEDALGKTIRFYGMEMHPQPLRIVGIVGNMRTAQLAKPAGSQVFVDAFQHDRLTQVTLAVRAPESAANAVAVAIHSVDPTLPVSFQGIDSILAESVARQRFQMSLLAIFAALALVLAAVGIYGVQSYNVARRTNELGIRLALGADRAKLLALVLREGATVTIAGLTLGIAGALLLTRSLASLLYNVSPADPLIFATITGLLAAVAMTACYLPARRAANTDPMTALRYE